MAYCTPKVFGPSRSVFVKRIEADMSVSPVAFLESYEKATHPFHFMGGVEHPNPLLLSLKSPHKPFFSAQ